MIIILWLQFHPTNDEQLVVRSQKTNGSGGASIHGLWHFLEPTRIVPAKSYGILVS